jgi:hypothetical protein
MTCARLARSPRRVVPTGLSSCLGSRGQSRFFSYSRRRRRGQAVLPVIANICRKTIDRLVCLANEAALFWREIRPTLEQLDGELRCGQSCQQPVVVNQERRPKSSPPLSAPAVWHKACHASGHA